MVETTKWLGGKQSLTHRLVLAGMGAVGLALLATAWTLQPDPRGYGTHEQLGLTSCWFQQTTTHVCPMCGATTAWAHVVRGRFVRATSVHLGGTLLCVMVMISAPWLFLSAMVGRWIVGKPALQTIMLVAVAWLLVVVLDWVRRLDLIN